MSGRTSDKKGVLTSPMENVELVLSTLALQGNSPARTAKVLKEGGFDFTSEQVTKLRNSNAARYEVIRRDMQGEISQRLAVVAEDLAMEAFAVQRLAVDRTREGLVHGSIRDPSAAARNLASTAAAASQQAALLRGQPTQIVEQRSAEEILKSLLRRVPGAAAEVVEGTATEVD